MFSHTENEDGTYNTRCLYCFLTIARSVSTEARLEKLEAGHLCPEMALSQLLDQQRSLMAASQPPAGHTPLRPN